MPKMIISLDGVVLKEVPLTKDRTSLGRRPYNDIVIDHLAVSGEHAVLQLSGKDGYIEDLNSTNGTYVNGKTVKKQLLKSADIVEIGNYKIQYVNEAGTTEAASPAGADADATSAALKIMTGAAAGREMVLVKPVTTLGKPGVAVAAITKGLKGFVLAHVDGDSRPTLNGAPVGAEAVTLKNGDLIELAGTQMKFVVY